MANQDFDLAGSLKVRPAEADDAAHLHAYCFPEQAKTQVELDLHADLAEDSGVHRLVAESSGYPIGQITVSKSSNDSDVATVSNLAVSGPFRLLGVADNLIAAAEAAAAEDGAKALEIELPSSETNVIQRYKDWGFVEKPLVILQKALEEPEAVEAEEEEAEETGVAEIQTDESQTVESQATEDGGAQQDLLNA